MYIGCKVHQHGAIVISFLSLRTQLMHLLLPCYTFWELFIPSQDFPLSAEIFVGAALPAANSKQDSGVYRGD